MPPDEPTKLLVLWTSGDREVALHMVLMYTGNAARHGWWEHVSLCLWGPSQRLFVEDHEVQARVQALRASGVRVTACTACAQQYRLVDALKSLGVEVFGMGVVLTNWLKSDNRVVTF